MARFGNFAGKGPMGLKGEKPLKTARTAKAPLRRAAHDQLCAFRFRGCQVVGTVACHIRLPNFCGVALKPDDLFMIDGCANCHAIFDDRSRWPEHEVTWLDPLRALMETQARRKAAGLISID